MNTKIQKLTGESNCIPVLEEFNTGHICRVIIKTSKRKLINLWQEICRLLQNFGSSNEYREQRTFLLPQVLKFFKARNHGRNWILIKILSNLHT